MTISHDGGAPHYRTGLFGPTLRARQPRSAGAVKRADNTAAACRANAAADLARASAPGSEYFRGRLERSAAAWTALAAILDELGR